MVHMICDFCGKCCDKEATLISLTPIHNHMNRHEGDIDISFGKKSNFICCQNCFKKQLKLPNPYEKYSMTCDENKISINKTIENYTDEDFLKD